MLCANVLTGFWGYTRPELNDHQLGLSNYNAAGATTLTASPDLTAGRFLVCAVGADNSGTNGASAFTSVVGANVTPSPMTVQEHRTRDPGAANAGVTLAICTGLVTASGAASLTANFSPAAPGRTWIAVEVWDTNGAPIEIVSSTSNAGNGAAPSVSSLMRDGDMMLSFLAQEARAAPTADGAYYLGARFGVIADSGTAGTSIALHTQTGRVVENTNAAWSPTMGAARDYVIGAIVLRATL